MKQPEMHSIFDEYLLWQAQAKAKRTSHGRL